ncbi:MAG: hypothetical protein R2867_10965 [Caldilineaceae bacterium]
MHVQTVGYNAPVNSLAVLMAAVGRGTAQGSEVYIYTAQFVLPSAGDYTVALQVPANYGATRYDVVFTIDGATGGSTNPNPVEPGELSLHRAQPLPSAVDCCPPVRGCSMCAHGERGQTMTIDATSDGTPLSMTIDDPAGFSMIPEIRSGGRLCNWCAVHAAGGGGLPGDIAEGRPHAQHQLHRHLHDSIGLARWQVLICQISNDGRLPPVQRGLSCGTS